MANISAAVHLCIDMHSSVTSNNVPCDSTAKSVWFPQLFALKMFVKASDE